MKTSAHAKPSGLPESARGILGGIFNPIHNGHCAVACLARDYFGLEKVYLVPSGMPPHKYEADITSPEHRLAMTRLAAHGSRSLAVWDGEIRRGGISYSIDTIQEIAALLPSRPLYFIIGSDNLNEIPTWNRYREILARVTLCVAHRPGHALHVPPELGSAVMKTFPSPEWALSSTLVRRYLENGYSCEHLLPAAVAQYIRRHGLYKKV
jgi:nicotinate-nucleotide adenylyltransferase